MWGQTNQNLRVWKCIEEPCKEKGGSCPPNTPNSWTKITSIFKGKVRKGMFGWYIVHSLIHLVFDSCSVLVPTWWELIELQPHLNDFYLSLIFHTLKISKGLDILLWQMKQDRTIWGHRMLRRRWLSGIWAAAGSGKTEIWESFHPFPTMTHFLLFIPNQSRL